MTKQEFLESLRKGLAGLNKKEIAERLAFYGEMIDDSMEEGLTEEEAVKKIGSVEQTVQQILAEKSDSSKKKTWVIVLLAVGSPVWISLLVSFVAVIVSLFVGLWTTIISLWAGLISVVVFAPVGLVASIAFVFAGNALSGLAILGAGIVCAGISVFLYFACKWATKGGVWLTKKFVKKTMKGGKKNA